MTLGLLNTRKWFSVFSVLLVCPVSLPAADPISPSPQPPQESAPWSASGGTMRIEFDPGLLANLEISVNDQVGIKAVDLNVESSAESRIELTAPFSSFQRFDRGELLVPQTLTLSRGHERVEFSGLILRPVSDRVLGVFEMSGHELFRLDYMHIMLYPDRGSIELLNMDMAMSPWLANALGIPELADFVIAGAHVTSELTVPFGAATVLRGTTCTTPNWHNGAEYQTDVALIDMSRIQMMAREEGGRVVIAPDAMLQNVGTADVPWHERFTTEPPDTTFPEPYGADQHPFLVWAMYRIVDDIPQQIGQSAVKHAFFSQNSICDCSGGHILWAAGNTPDVEGCGDLYSLSTNDNPLYLGVRSEIPAFTGDWDQCGSMFAPDATESPCDETYNGDTADEYERRLVVEESELETENADYLFEAWYVIRDDVNIFNTFAYKQIVPEWTGSMWDFNDNVFDTINGPALNAWVAPGTRGANEIHTVETTANGHFSVAVKVSDLGGGNYRFVYALMNYDYDPQFDSFSLPIPTGALVSNDQFLDGDSDMANDWVFNNSGGMLTWTAPVDVGLEWGHMTTFVFEVDAPAVSGSVDLSALEMELFPSISVLVPGIPPIFEDGFEILTTLLGRAPH